MGHAATPSDDQVADNHFIGMQRLMQRCSQNGVGAFNYLALRQIVKKKPCFLADDLTALTT